MEIVSSKSDEDFAKERATADVRRAARELSANLIRVVRGAGRPFELLAQCENYLVAAENHFETHGRWPTSEVTEAASLRYRSSRNGSERVWSERESALDEIVEGALQMAASQILGQSTQEAAGERQLNEGIRLLQEYRERKRAEYQKSTPGFTPRQKPRPKR